MPSSASNARSTQGWNQHVRSQQGKPISGSDARPPRAPAGVRHVANRCWDARSTLTTAAVMLLAGQAMAGTAAVTAGPRRSDAPLGGAVPPTAGLSASCADIPARVWSLPRSARTAFPYAPPPTAHWGDLPDMAGALMRPLESLAGHEALAVAEESAGGGRSLVWQTLAAWFADPCTDLDQYANGFWKLSHPPAVSPPSFFSEALRTLSAEVHARLSPASTAGSGPERVVAHLCANALDSRASGWAASQPRFDDIAKLASRRDIERHIVAAVVGGNPLVLELHRFGRDGVLAPGLPTRQGAASTVHDPGTSQAALEADKAAMAVLLERAGVPAAELQAAADTVSAMEAALATAAPNLAWLTLQEAQRRLPDLPWGALWQVIGIDPDVPIYLELGAFGALSSLLRDHSVRDWQRLLGCQQARRVQAGLTGERTLEDVVSRLQYRRGGQLLLSSWFSTTVQPDVVGRAQAMFTALRQVFDEDIRGSALPAVDRQRLADRFASVALAVDVAGSALEWDRFVPSGSFLDDLQSLDALATRDDLRIIRTAQHAPIDARPAHDLVMYMLVRENSVHVSPALLGLLGSADLPRETRWGRLGAMLGHELGHVLGKARGLSTAGEAFMAREDAALRQRVADLWVDDIQLNATAARDEVGCDLRGLSAARRAGQAEAAAAGERFDDRAFFLAAATLQATHPTARQLRDQVDRQPHPPGPFRAELGRFMEGFQRAFGCEPRPSAPFDRILTPAGRGREVTSPPPPGPNPG